MILPSQGFISREPRNSMGQLYQYCENNPTGLIDPLGFKRLGPVLQGLGDFTALPADQKQKAVDHFNAAIPINSEYSDLQRHSAVAWEHKFQGRQDFSRRC